MGSELENDWTTDFVKTTIDEQSNYVFSDLIQPGTGSYIIGPYDFANLTIGEALKRLSKFDGYSFYVDVDEGGNFQLRYFKPSNTQSITVTEEDIVDYSPFTWSDFDLYNKVVVKGAGGITADQTDSDSTTRYGVYTKIVTDPTIEETDDAQAVADAYVRRFGNPSLTGRVTIMGDETLNLQKGVTFDVDYINISGTHNILGYTHKIDKNGFYTTVEFGESEFNLATNMNTLQTNIDQTAESLTEGAPGADGDVIFNNGGVWGTDAGLTYDDGPEDLTVGGGIAADHMQSDGYLIAKNIMVTLATSSQIISGGSVSSSALKLSPKSMPPAVIGKFWMSSNGLFICTGSVGGWRQVQLVAV